MSEWLSGNLGDIADIVMGQSPTGESVNTNGLGVPLLNGPTEFTIRYPKAVQFSTDPKRFSKVNDILFCVRGSTTGRMNWADEDYAIGRGLAAIRHKQGEEYRYFVKAILDYYLDTMLASASGSTFPNVSKDQLNELEISYPSFPEQKAIASVLSSLDDKIDLLHRQNKTLEAMAETLFRQWFIEEAKEDWEDCILGDILEVLESGSRPKGGIDPELKSGIPSLGAESINGICKFDYSKVKYVTLEFADSCKKGHAQPWDVLIYKDGAYVGKKALFGEKFPYPRFMINEHVFRLRSNTRCSQLYLYFALDSESLALLNSNSAQPGINQQSLKSYQITLPPKEKMEAFDSVVRPLTTKMNENAIQISTCEKLRDTLLPKLISGEVRVQYQTEEVV